MTDADRYCRDLVRDTDKDRFLASLFAPAERRRDLYALYAFNSEIARVRDRIDNPLAGEVRLQWWREVLAGRRAQEAGAHPVAASLLAAIARRDLPASVLGALVDARTFDLYDEPMQSLGELERYACRTSSALFDLALAVFGIRAAAPLTQPAGIAYAFTGLVRAFARHAARRQLFVPVDVLARHGVSVADVFAGRSSPGLRMALVELRDHARRQLVTLAERAASASPEALIALLPVALARGYLNQTDKPDYAPFRTVVDVPQWRRQWVLWRAARGRLL